MEETDPVSRPSGVNDSEKLLTEYCERSFFKLWSYSNPYNDQAKEFCDVLAVIDDKIFMFFDRRSAFQTAVDLRTAWSRWKKKTVDKQLKTIAGAERYLRNGRPIFLDAKKKTLLPVKLDLERMKLYRILIAHGTKESAGGSLALSYDNLNNTGETPFSVKLDKSAIVHVFDSNSLPIVFSTLDTILDFSTYLDAKEDAINSSDRFSYDAEEDVVARFFSIFDAAKNRPCIVPQGVEERDLVIPRGLWQQFNATNAYRRIEDRRAPSYLWDRMLARMCEKILVGEFVGDSPAFARPSPILEMTKEPRFCRHTLSDLIHNLSEDVLRGRMPTALGPSIIPSFYLNRAYVFLPIPPAEKTMSALQAQSWPRKLLQAACVAAKTRCPQFQVIIGVGMEYAKPPGAMYPEHFILLDFATWTPAMFAASRDAAEASGFFKSVQMMHLIPSTAEDTSVAIPANEAFGDQPVLFQPDIP